MKKRSKITYSLMGATVGLALLLAAGCSKQEQPAGETPKPAEAPKPAASTEAAPAAEKPKPAMSATPATAPAAEPAPAASGTLKAADATPAANLEMKAAVSSAVQQAAGAATNQAAASVAAANSQVQALIDKAKGLVTDQKYKDALTAVQQLSSLRLTPEQRTLVDGLKTEIQAALAKDATSDAASALGNVLGGKK